jgi:hypothetical protein
LRALDMIGPCEPPNLVDQMTYILSNKYKTEPN